MTQKMESNSSKMSEFRKEVFFKPEVVGNCEESLEVHANVLDGAHLNNGKYQLIYTEYVDVADGAEDNCNGQLQEMDTEIYTIHIQEAEDQACDEACIKEESINFDEPKMVTFARKDSVMETDVNEMSNEKADIPVIKYVQNLEGTGSKYAEENGNAILSDSQDKTEGEGFKRRKLVMELSEEAVYARHGLDLSLPITCDMCNIDFDCMSKFDEHMMKHVETRVFMCQLCPKTYLSWQNLVAHRKVCHFGQFISCDNCTRRKIHYDLGRINFPVGDYPVGCEECKAGFQTVNELNRHYRSHTVVHLEINNAENIHGGNFCEKSKVIKTSNENINGIYNCCVSREEIHKINSTASANVIFKCNTCQKEMSSFKSYTLHEIFHSDITVHFRCPHCSELFDDRTNYENHRDLHNNSEEYNCKVCRKKFKSNLSLRVHKYSHSVNENFRCFNCQMDFTTSCALSQHIETVHYQCPDIKLICDICTLNHPVDKFIEHYLLCHARLKCKKSVNNGSSVCEICDKVFPYPKALERHLQSHHDPISSVIFVRPSYLCEVCGMLVQNTGPFIAHIRSHGKEYYRNCTELNGNVKENILNNRPKTQSSICEFCGRGFKNKTLLQLHVRRHTGEKPYQCTMCKMAFYTGEQLSVHIRQHTGERPYACTVCGKSFASSGVLHAHRRLHNSIKQHSCPVCEKTFLWRSAYHNHMRTHSAIRPFKCEECPRTFLFKYKLTAHKKFHEKEKEKSKQQSHQCSDCGQSFTTAVELQSHHEDKCYLTMITFMQPNEDGNKDTPLIILNANSSTSFS